MADSQILKEYLLKLGFVVDQSSSKKFDDALLKKNVNIIKLAGGMIAAASAAQAMVVLWARSMERLYYSSKRIDDTAANLQKLEFGAKQVGVSGETMRKTMEGFARSIRANPGLTGLLQNLGVQTGTNKPTQQLVDLVKQLNAMPPYIGQQFAAMFGMDPDTYFQLSQNVGELEKAMKLREKMAADVGLDSDAAAKAGKEYAQSWNEITERAGVFKDVLMVALLPTMQAMAKVTNEMLTDWAKITPLLVKDRTKISDDISKKGWGDFFTRLMEGATGKADPSRGTVTLSQDSRDRIKQGYTDGTAPLGLRQHNPGNMRGWAKGQPMANGFAVFDSDSQGLSAMAGQLVKYTERGINTIRGIVNTWAPPGDGNNNNGAYMARLMKATGQSADTPLNFKGESGTGALTAVMRAMVGFEQGRDPFNSDDYRTAATSRNGANISQVNNITITAPGADQALQKFQQSIDRTWSDVTRNMSGAQAQ